MELVILLVLFFGVSMIQGAARKKGKQGRMPIPRGGQDQAPDLMGELRRALEEMKGRQPESGPFPAQSEPGWGEAGVMGASGVVSLEEPVDRPERVIVDYDDQAEAVVNRRLKWVDDHAGALTDADHRAFDAKIRAKPKFSKPAGPDRAATMRHLFIWHEVLGKPVALRDLDR